MADHSHIEWTDATWNPITGCTLVSEGCRNCYAATLAATRLKHHPSRAGLARVNAAGEAKFTGKVRLNEQWLDQPLRWRKPRMIFVCAHGDLFHPAVPDEWIDRVFAVMALAPQHTFQVLTKRPEKARKYMAALIGNEDRCRDVIEASLKAGALLGDLPDLRDRLVTLPLPNVWLGTSVEDQPTADERIPHLLDTPAAVRFVSAEPLLGPVDLTRIPVGGVALDALRGDGHASSGLDWIICGGESGPGARPMHADWARSMRDQCQTAGVAFFLKQWGEWLPFAQSGFTQWSAANVRNNGIAKKWLGYAHFNDGAGGAETCRLGPVETVTLQSAQETMGTQFVRLGKKRAGRLLDGREWSEMPERPHG